MPLYQFSNKKGEIQDFFFDMSKAPSIGATVKIEGKIWKRIPHLPQAHIDAHIDPFDNRKIMEKTNKTDTLGSLMDRAKELSEKRKSKNSGVDPVQQKWFKDYSKQRSGKKHPNDK